jgi:hypothetical protein
MIIDLHEFLQSEPDTVIWAMEIAGQQFRLEKNQLSNFYQL